MFKNSILVKVYHLVPKLLKRQFIIAIFLSVFVTVLEMVGIGIIIPVLSVMVDDNSVIGLWITSHFPSIKTKYDLQVTLILSVIVFYLIKTVVLFYYSLFQNRFIFSILAYFGNSLFKGYIFKDYAFHVSKKSSDLIRNLTSELGVFTSYLQASILVVSEMSILISVAFLLVLLNPLTSLASILLFGLLAYLFLFFTKKMNARWGKQRHKYEGDKIQVITQSIDGFREIKHYSKELLFIKRFEYDNKMAITPTERQYTVQSLPRISFEFFAVCGCMGFLLFQVVRGNEIVNLIPSLGLFFLAAFRILPSYNRITASFSNIHYAKPYVLKLYEELVVMKEETIARQESEKSEVIGSFHFNKIEFVDFGFYYDPENPIFDKASFEINKGEMIAITGPSGAGKSTLIDILLGFLRPQQGHILVDGTDIKQQFGSYRKNVGFVPQQFYIFNDTIKYNISLSAPEEVDHERLQAAVDLSQLNDLVNNLPAGLETFVGDNGAFLSGGQKQRIAIARALYNNPGILILDEPTSSLDGETEDKIIESLIDLKQKLGLTIILITHRVANLSFCDKVYEIRDKNVLTPTKHIK